MNARVREVLGDVVARHGAGVATDAARCEALLRDLCPEDRREVAALVAAVKARVAGEIERSSGSGTLVSRLGGLAKRLEDDAALTPEAARWAVESWAVALGVAPASGPEPPVAPPAVPRPAPAAPPPPPPPAPAAPALAVTPAAQRSGAAGPVIGVLAVIAIVVVGIWLASRPRPQQAEEVTPTPVADTTSMAQESNNMAQDTTSMAPDTTTMAPDMSQGQPSASTDAGTATRDDCPMVLVPAGEFTMGSAAGEGSDDERPQHRVYVSAFYLDQYEVTNAQYQRFIQSGGYANRSYWSDAGWTWRSQNNVTQPLYWSSGENNSGPNYPRHPVMGVSWYEAEAYARWTGKRLPTEAEWEKAARGTDGRKYPWGNEEPTCGRANFSGCGGGTKPVGSCPSGTSPYGAYDLAGNVYEWCADWYDSGYYGRSPSADPPGPSSGSSRVLRGGAWDGSAGYLRSAYRGYYSPGGRVINAIGFRCARTFR